MKIASLLFVLMLAAGFTASNPAFAGQNSLTFYGKGTTIESDSTNGVVIRTLISEDTAVIIRVGNGIEVVRMNIVPSNACIQTKATLCFDGTVNSVKNTESYKVGDKIGIMLDFANNKETITVNSEVISGTAVAINLTKTNIHLSGPYVITVAQEGGFAGIQKEIIIDTASGTVSGDTDKTLDDDSTKSITNAVKKSHFFDMSDYYPSIEGAADYFTYTIRISQGMFEKTVVWTDTSENAPKKISDLYEIIVKATDVSENINTSQIEIAKDFVKTSPTFTFDGIEESLTVIDALVLESFPEQHVITIGFDSLHGGYGNRADQMITQAITHHTIVIKIVEGTITSAIVDEKWDEINQELFDD